MSTLSSANITNGNLLLKERTYTINNKIQLHILGVPPNKLGNWLMMCDDDDDDDVDHVRRLRKLYNVLSEKLVASTVSAEMFQGDALSISELESIQQSRDSPSLAAQQLMNILMRSPRETYHYFLDALKRTDQIDTYMCLVLEGEYCHRKASGLDIGSARC